MVDLVLDKVLEYELIYRYTLDDGKNGLVAFNRKNGDWRYIQKISGLSGDEYTEMLAYAVDKVMNAKEIPQSFSIVFF